MTGKQPTPGAEPKTRSAERRTPAAAVAHRIADDFERRLATFSGPSTAARESAARTTSDPAPAGSDPADLRGVAAADREDQQRVVSALASQAEKVRAAMVADLERLMAVVGESR
jgi:hypothetical protein